MRIVRLIAVLLAVLLVFVTVRQVTAAPSTCTVTGTLYYLNAVPAANQRVYFSYDQAQNQSSTILPAGAFSVTTNSSGVLPAVTAVQGAYMYVKVGSGPVTKIQIPLQSSADLSTLISANTDPPAIVSQIASANGNCSVINPSIGAIGTATINCSGGSGSGTVQSSITGYIAAYPGNGTIVGGVALNSPFANTGSALIFQPITAVNFNSQQATGLSAATSSGGALAYGLNDLSQLAPATGNYLMGDHSIGGLSLLFPNTDTTAIHSVGHLLGGQFTLNNEYNPNDPFFGADPTGSNDSGLAITKAAAAASAAAGANNDAFSTRLPGGIYNIQEPILITANYPPSPSGAQNPVQFLGAGQFATQIHNHQVAGPGIVVFPVSWMVSANNGNPLKQAALVTGSSGSAQWASNGAGEWSIDDEELLGVAPLNGLSQFDSRGFYKPTISSPSNPEVLAFSGGGVDYYKCSHDSTLDGCIGAFARYRGTDGKLHCQVTLSTSGQIKAVSSASFTVNAVNEAECSYNGSDLYAILNGTASSGVAGTGTIVQNPDETMLTGGMAQYFHLGGWSNWPGGYIDSDEIASIARNTSNYTQHTAAYTGDTHSLLLFDGYGTNLDIPSNISPAGTWPWAFEPSYLKGAIIDGFTNRAWVEAKTTGIGCCGSQVTLTGFDVIGGTVAIASQISALNVSHVAEEGQTYLGLETTVGSFTTQIDHLISGENSGGSATLSPLVLQGGISSVTQSEFNGTGIMGPYLASASLRDAYVSPSSTAQWGVVCDGPCVVDNLNEDSENGGTFPGFTINQDKSNSTFSRVSNTVIEQSGTGEPPIRVECTNNLSLVLDHDDFIIQTNSLTTEVDATNCSNNFGNPIDFIDSLINDSPAIQNIPASGITLVNNGQLFHNRGAVGQMPVYSAAGHALGNLPGSVTNVNACVSDSTACTSGTTYVSGGSDLCTLSWNGSAWIETGVPYCVGD